MPQRRVLDQVIDGPIAWTGAAISSPVLTVCEQSLAQLHELIAVLRENPLPITALRHQDFDLPDCRRLMARAGEVLSSGVGFVLIDRLPTTAWSVDEARAVSWLLCSMIARPVAQKWDGTMIYDVCDRGRPVGNGVRADVTNAGQNFHTDNSYNLCPPDYVALLCLQTAMRGGVNSVVSFQTAHNRMRERHPELLDRLYEDYIFDRQREHAPDDSPVLRHPLIELHGDVPLVRLSRALVLAGHKLAGESLDAKGADALDAFEAIINGPDMAVAFHFQPGQLQIVDNRRCGHRRTAFTDWPDPARRRHLIRLWLRDQGRPFYHG